MIRQSFQSGDIARNIERIKEKFQIFFYNNIKDLYSAYKNGINKKNWPKYPELCHIRKVNYSY